MSKTLSAPVRGQGYRVRTQVEPCGAYDFAIHEIEILFGPEKGRTLRVQTWGTLDMRGVQLNINGTSDMSSIRDQIRGYCARNLVGCEITAW